MAKVIIDPITRIEGHLAIEIEVEGGKVKDAYSKGEMFRGLELILKGRNPVDAQQIAQRICGVCPMVHGTAAAKNLDSAFGITPPKNGWLIRNIMLGSNYLQSHILHFYHLAALDFVDITAIANYKGSDRGLQKVRDWVLNGLELAKAGEPVAIGPFLPRYEGDYYIKDTDVNIELIAHYLKALEMRRKAHEMLTIFGGRMPHALGIVPGGASQAPTVDRIVQYKRRLAEIADFVENVYFPDVIALAKLFPSAAKTGVGYGNFLAYGVFDEVDGEDYEKRYFPAGVVKNWKLEKFDHRKIAEYVDFSRYTYSKKGGLYPHDGETNPAPDKKGAYTWLKAPRYDGLPMEVGPSARMAIAYLKNHPDAKPILDSIFKELGTDYKVLDSTIGRHLARAVEAKLLIKKLDEWASKLEPDKPFVASFSIPKESKGMGLVDGPRGALGHWIVIKDGKIANYQAIVPTTWNASPRDNKKQLGPMEKALLNAPVPDLENPIEPARIVRSFDPCLACAIHLVNNGNSKVFKII